MSEQVTLIYGLLFFASTVVVSIPFGFVQGYRQVRGNPMSEKSRSSLKRLEQALEATAVTILTAHLGAQQASSDPMLHALGAYIVAFVVAYPLEVLLFKMSSQEFVARCFVGLVVCLPIGLCIAYALHRVA